MKLQATRKVNICKYLYHVSLFLDVRVHRGARLRGYVVPRKSARVVVQFIRRGTIAPTRRIALVVVQRRHRGVPKRDSCLLWNGHVDELGLVR